MGAEECGARAHYREHFDAVRDVLKSEWPALKATDPQHQVLTHMVDSLSLNPTYTLKQKKQMVSMSAKFLRGEKLDFTVQELKGTQQFNCKRAT